MRQAARQRHVREKEGRAEDVKNKQDEPPANFQIITSTVANLIANIWKNIITNNFNDMDMSDGQVL
tara:strand:- start:92 stop:289 length:198 start_codon:yes stop_codon:yes gene_type:complete